MSDPSLHSPVSLFLQIGLSYVLFLLLFSHLSLKHIMRVLSALLIAGTVIYNQEIIPKL